MEADSADLAFFKSRFDLFKAFFLRVKIDFWASNFSGLLRYIKYAIIDESGPMKQHE